MFIQIVALDDRSSYLQRRAIQPIQQPMRLFNDQKFQDDAMRKLIYLAPLFLFGCVSVGGLQLPVTKAYYPNTPTELFTAVAEACLESTQRLERPSDSIVECHEALSPDLSAKAILRYDGKPDQLPELIIRFTSTKDATGYLVENQVFISVVQKDGVTKLVPLETPNTSANVARLFKRTGGEPLPHLN
jgi:hypothetical protein